MDAQNKVFNVGDSRYNTNAANLNRFVLVDTSKGATLLPAARTIPAKDKGVPIRQIIPKVGRNDKCPCGQLSHTGQRKKFKNCCKKRFVD